MELKARMRRGLASYGPASSPLFPSLRDGDLPATESRRSLDSFTQIPARFIHSSKRFVVMISKSSCQMGLQVSTGWIKSANRVPRRELLNQRQREPLEDGMKGMAASENPIPAPPEREKLIAP